MAIGSKYHKERRWWDRSNDLRIALSIHVASKIPPQALPDPAVDSIVPVHQP